MLGQGQTSPPKLSSSYLREVTHHNCDIQHIISTEPGIEKASLNTFFEEKVSNPQKTTEIINLCEFFPKVLTHTWYQAPELTLPHSGLMQLPAVTLSRNQVKMCAKRYYIDTSSSKHWEAPSQLLVNTNIWIMIPAGPVTSAPSLPWLSNSCSRDVSFLRAEVTHPHPQAPSRVWGHRGVQAGWAAVPLRHPAPQEV